MSSSQKELPELLPELNRRNNSSSLSTNGGGELRGGSGAVVGTGGAYTPTSGGGYGSSASQAAAPASGPSGASSGVRKRRSSNVSWSTDTPSNVHSSGHSPDGSRPPTPNTSSPNVNPLGQLPQTQPQSSALLGAAANQSSSASIPSDRLRNQVSNVGQVNSGINGKMIQQQLPPGSSSAYSASAAQPGSPDKHTMTSLSNEKSKGAQASGGTNTSKQNPGSVATTATGSRIVLSGETEVIKGPVNVLVCFSGVWTTERAGKGLTLADIDDTPPNE
ncbi:hypothetical protein HDU93_000791 [Gonapodya sp. JEL0774]|nr:hypothetical protein HDU93_000791 [Gonapodya sp. JEL0774]